MGVRKFDNEAALHDYLASDEFEESPDGITLLQEYIDAPSKSIFRMEFVDSKFLYAVEVDTTQGFELCPADVCELESNCPTEETNKFEIVKDFSISNIRSEEHTSELQSQ